MKLAVIFLLVLISCGEKKPAPPLKVQGEKSRLLMSPQGITKVQGLFNVYSSDGKLSVEEIYNIAHRISPKLSSYIENLNLSAGGRKKINAPEFFSILGESNKAIYWALTYDLQTEDGWTQVIKSEFAWADEGLVNETTKLITQLLKDLKTQAGHELFISRLLKVGGVFNLLDSTEPTPGSILDAISRRIIVSSSSEKNTGPTEETMRLVKFTFILKYVLLADSETKEETKLDRFSQWSVDCMEESIAKNFPGIKTKTLARVLQDSTESILRRNPKTFEDIHLTLHPIAYKNLGRPNGVDISSLSAFDIYQLVRSTCKNNTLPNNLSNWIEFFDSRLSKLNYTIPGFCDQIKDIDPRIPEVDSRQPAAHKSDQVRRGRIRRSEDSKYFRSRK